MQLAISILGYIGAVLVASLSIPQLFKIIKDRKTGDVNFYSFWIFHTGILLWIVWSALSPNKLHNIIIPNTITMVIQTITLGLMYLYKSEFNQKTKLKAWIALGIYLIIGIIFIALHIGIYAGGIWKQLIIPASLEAIMGFVFPAFTTLAFLPQFIQSLRTHNWGGLSYGMFVIYITNNFVWIIWWILQIVAASSLNAPVGSFVGGLIWQVISISLFSTQFAFTIIHQK
ncbi:PQ-loop domain-containing transporter [Mycoplasmopsis bovirhinis]|uniref:PQ loop repeat n=1 Tax=Mycoplasmopsis bovirhinis TaxID=29553 RepID=A0A449AEF6_9BACT|nr:PQ-loop domain-containing transporter [Mycoplasmopsis bovirhinis]VEU63380.1 PQ loop repeat [Mycoplasmopsis bovirhinis]